MYAAGNKLDDAKQHRTLHPPSRSDSPSGKVRQVRLGKPVTSMVSDVCLKCGSCYRVSNRIALNGSRTVEYAFSSVSAYCNNC